MSIAAPTRQRHERRRYSGTGLPRMRRSAHPPKSEMNVTPFIDVLLVLLVMIILAVPIKVHQTTVDLPTGELEPVLPISEINTVFINEADQLFWNGEALSSKELRAQISAASELPKEPVLRFEPTALASYNRAAQTISLIQQAGATKFVFVGNAQHRDFGN